jgi:5'-methylthioadenosine phosphorylase
MDFAVIGGTGFYGLSDEQLLERIQLPTEFGPVQVERVRLADQQIAFLARHGGRHTIPPHRVNYRANIRALRDLGVKNILASAAVGSMSEEMPPGSLVVLTQFLDFTRSRSSTFFDVGEQEVVHVDMTDPYCSHLRAELEAAAHALGEEIRPQGTYVCVEGPRFETPAEIRMFRKLGGDIVGMTNVPEVALAREAGICYAAVAIVTNWAAGISENPLKHDHVSDFMARQAPRVRSLFQQVIQNHTEILCSCRLSQTS